MVQLLYLLNVELDSYKTLMIWLFSDQKNYLTESFMSLTFIILLIGITSITDKKQHVNLSIYLAASINFIIFSTTLFADGPVNFTLRKSTVSLTVILILIWFLNHISFKKFERPCRIYNLPAMDEKTSIYDVVYTVVPIVLLVGSWWI